MWLIRTNKKSYNTYKALVTLVKVVSNVAERELSLVKDYNKLHSIDKKLKQYLLLLVI